MTDTWSAGISAVHIESGGVMRLCLVNPSEQGEILFAAMAGDPLARCLRRLIKPTTFQIKLAPRRKPALCLVCPRPIRKIQDIGTYVFVLPEVQSPVHAIGTAVCAKCAEGGDLLDRAMAAFQRHLWGDIRRIDISASCGHG